jgi:hypothetical protein
MKKKTKLYMHQPTGNIMYATDKQAAKLDDNWHVVQFVKNEKGESVMRFTFKDENGVTATADVSQTTEVQPNGQPVTK